MHGARKIVNSIDYRRMAVDAIELIHRFYSYKDISTILGIPPSMISRYLRKHVLPSKDIAEKVLNKIINNNEIIIKIANLVKDDPDVLYDDDVSNTLLLLVVNKFLDKITKSDAIITFNDPSISLAIKLKNVFSKSLIVLYFAPIVPGQRAECFSIIANPVAVFACTRYNIIKERFSSALLLLPLVINIEDIGIVWNRVKDILRIREVIPLAILCGKLERSRRVSINCILCNTR